MRTKSETYCVNNRREISLDEVGGEIVSRAVCLYIKSQNRYPKFED